MRRMLQLIGTGIVASLTACGGSDEPPENAAETSLDAFLSDRVQALCEAAVRCGIVSEAGICEANFPDADGEQVKVDVATGSVVFHAERAEACIAFLRNETCRFDTDSRAAYWATCGEALVGTVEDGGGCFSTTECAGGAYCSFSECTSEVACCAGVCVVAGEAGAACKSALGLDCAPGTYCGPSATDDRKCEPKKALGAACKSDVWNPCVDGAYCASPNGGFDGECVPTPELGEPCDSTQWLFACSESGLFCDPSTNTCAALAHVDEPCTAPEGCMLEATCEGGVCAPLAVVGQTCPGGDVDCVSLTCLEGVCALPAEMVCP